jgi:hypothetical protein
MQVWVCTITPLVIRSTVMNCYKLIKPPIHQPEQRCLHTRGTTNQTIELYPRRKEPKYPMSRRLGGSLSRSGRFGEGKNLVPLPGFESCLVQLLAQSLY